MPRLSANPPNLSIILYSLGCISFFYVWFNSDYKVLKKSRVIRWGRHLLLQMGQYSLDIFIWHMLVRVLLFVNPNMIVNIWLKRIYAYIGMFFIPIIVRKMYEDIKSIFKIEMAKLVS